MPIRTGARMKRITVITDFRFWERDSGSKNRTYSLINYLDRFFKMHIVFLDRVTKAQEKSVASLGLRSLFFGLDASAADGRYLPIDEPELREYTDARLVQSLRRFLTENRTDIVINTNIRTHVYMQNLPYPVTTVIDLHDLMHLRAASFGRHALKHTIDLSCEREFAVLDTYDSILAIQSEEYSHCLKYLSASKLLLVPHAVRISKTYTSKETIGRIGFIATDNPANTESIRWFLERVWCRHACFSGLTLNIYGTIVKRFKKRPPFVVLVGPVEDLESVYRECDAMIAPMRAGSGLKIKSVEALAHGLPLVTSSLGAEGMQAGSDDAFLRADSPQEWQGALTALMLSAELRDALSDNAQVLARSRFSEEACYGEFVRWLKRDVNDGGKTIG